MKLLTLNTHSLQEQHGQRKLDWFVQSIQAMRPDLIALQEVNQTMTAAPAPPDQLNGYVPVSGHSIPVLEDNYAVQTALRLSRTGIPCVWTWLPMKRGFEKYDEGLALFSLGAPIVGTDVIQVSSRADYENWHTRMALGVQLKGRTGWFYTVHMGWWGDREDPFSDQWKRLEERLAEKKLAGPVWLLGDFNAPAHVRGESYDQIRDSGWQDTYQLAARRDDGITVEGGIDGWRDKIPAGVPTRMRMDYIWRSQPMPIARSQVVFNGINHPIISDHYGILIETEGTR